MGHNLAMYVSSAPKAAEPQQRDLACQPCSPGLSLTHPGTDAQCVYALSCLVHLLLLTLLLLTLLLL